MTDQESDNSLEKIRDLLFGRQLTGVDQKIALLGDQLAALETLLASARQTLQDEIDESNRSLRAELDKRTDELTQALGEEIRHRLREHPSRTELAGLFAEISDRLRQPEQ